MDNQQFKELSERLESINKNIINGTNNIASWLEPDMELVQQCTVYPEPYVDFKKLAEMAGATEEIKAKHYIPPSDSKPTVTVQFKK